MPNNTQKYLHTLFKLKIDVCESNSGTSRHEH